MDECGKLITDGLAATGGQHRQQTVARQTSADDGTLQRGTVGRRWMWAETRLAEEGRQERLGIVVLTAIGTVGLIAVDLPQRGDPLPDGRQFMEDPMWKDGIATGHADPVEGKCNRPWVVGVG